MNDARPTHTHTHTRTDPAGCSLVAGGCALKEGPGPLRLLLLRDHAAPSLKTTFQPDQNRPLSSGLPSLKMHQASQTSGSRPRGIRGQRMEALPGPHRHPVPCAFLAFWRPRRRPCLPLTFNHSIPIPLWKLGCSLSRPSFKTPCPTQGKRWAPEPSPLHRPGI